VVRRIAIHEVIPRSWDGDEMADHDVGADPPSDASVASRTSTAADVE